MQFPRVKLFILVIVLLTVSATCSGFLLGRTAKLHEEGKFEQFQQMSEKVIDLGTLVVHAYDIVRRVVLR